MKLNNVHYPFIIIIISCIILETDSEFMGNTYLSSNENPQESEDSTFRLLQESKEYLYFQWNPFKREYYGALFLEIEDGVSRQMPDDVEEATLKTVGPACEVQTYSLRQSVGRAIVGYYDKELRELNFKRIFRVQHGTLTITNDKSINLTWEIENEICSTEDLIIIFKKDSSGFHRMYTVTVNERNFNFMEELHNDEHVIMTTYHENSFGLSELVIYKNHLDNLDVKNTSNLEKQDKKFYLLAAGIWKPVIVGVLYFVICICILVCIYFSCKR